MSHKFSFKEHQNYTKSRKMIFRYIIYTVVISFLIYLILKKENTPIEKNNEEIINQFDVEITPP